MGTSQALLTSQRSGGSSNTLQAENRSDEREKRWQLLLFRWILCRNRAGVDPREIRLPPDAKASLFSNMRR